MRQRPCTTLANVSRGINVQPENLQLNSKEQTEAVGCTVTHPSKGHEGEAT